MTAVCHRRNDKDEFTDEQLVTHLITSPCSECRDAGFRLQELLEEKQEQRSAVETKGAKFTVEIIHPIEYSPDLMEFVCECDSFEQALETAKLVPVPERDGPAHLEEAYHVRIACYDWPGAVRPKYVHTWHSTTERYKPR